MPSRRDVRLGRVQPRVGYNGVVSPPGLQVNELSLEEHQLRLEMTKGKWPPLTREEALRLYGEDEVREVFGE